MKVLWNTEIYKRYKDIFHIVLYEQIVKEDMWTGSNTSLLTVQWIDDSKGIEILEDADQIRSIATGEYILMSEVVMSVPDELLDIYDLTQFVEVNYSFTCTSA
jgi:hypothetical protein